MVPKINPVDKYQLVPKAQDSIITVDTEGLIAALNTIPTGFSLTINANGSLVLNTPNNNTVALNARVLNTPNAPVTNTFTDA